MVQSLGWIPSASHTEKYRPTYTEPTQRLNQHEEALRVFISCYLSASSKDRHVWRSTPKVPALGKRRQEDQGVMVILGYIVRSKLTWGI